MHVPQHAYSHQTGSEESLKNCISELLG
jgi:hypothetical protein